VVGDGVIAERHELFIHMTYRVRNLWFQLLSLVIIIVTCHCHASLSFHYLKDCRFIGQLNVMSSLVISFLSPSKCCSLSVVWLLCHAVIGDTHKANTMANWLAESSNIWGKSAPHACSFWRSRNETNGCGGDKAVLPRGKFGIVRCQAW
jgi:hypothetical protein